MIPRCSGQYVTKGWCCDEATRIQHLGELSTAGRGFGVRRKDMKKMLIATRGKVFTLRNLDRLIDCSRLKEYRTK